MSLLYSLRDPQLIGVYTALVTPFKSSGSLDLTAFDRLLDFQIEGEVSGVVINGTTGESPTLKEEEKKALILRAKKRLKKTNLQVIAGTGGNSTRETVEFSRWASDQGVDSLLIVTPYYNKPTQAGLKQHYIAIAEKVRVPIILYNVPGRTGVSLQVQTIIELAQHPRIIAIKEATGALALGADVLSNLPTQVRMNILSGDDPLWIPSLLTGTCGVISVASNLIPREMSSAFQAYLSQDLSSLLEFQRKYWALFRDLFIESNPVPVKALLHKMGLCSATVRTPLAPLSSANKRALETTWKHCQI